MINESKFTLDSLIGIFPQILSKEYCDNVITYFNYLQNYNLTFSRKQVDGSIVSQKVDNNYFLSQETDPSRILTNTKLVLQAMDAIDTAVNWYANNVYGINELAKNLELLPFKIQKTLPGQGYHIWHHEQNNIQESHRLLSMILYLNDINDGGETEFIHQKCRIKPQTGTLLIFPSSFTHTHRGNPPLKEVKYIIASWFALTK